MPRQLIGLRYCRISISQIFSHPFLYLHADIQEAKELPIPLSLFSQEYPSKGISDFNWSPSYEQYKQQVGNLQENQDDLYETIEGMQDEIKELNKQITNLRIAVQ